MIKNIKILLPIQIIILSVMMISNLSGCSKRNLNLLRDDVSVFGTAPLIEPDPFEKIDIVLLLNPMALEKDRNKKKDPLNKQRRKIDKAYDAFYKNPIDQKIRRNRIQERILSASVQRCGEYKNFLKQFDAGSNTFLGSLTTTLAGAGAIFTSVSTVRALSGSAAIISGVQSEFNENYFSGKTIQMLTHGFDSKRDELYERMLINSNQSLSRYPVEAAIKDAIVYHASCSLITGLEQAAMAIERVKNPGLKGTQQALVEAKKLEYIMNTKPSMISTINLSDPIGLNDGNLLKTKLNYDDPLGDDLPMNILASARAHLSNLQKKFMDLSKELKTDELKTIVELAVQQSKEVLKENLEKDAEEITITIQKARAKVIEEIDPNKKELLEIELVKKMLDGQIITQGINKILFGCQISYNYAEIALNDKAVTELATRVKNAKARMNKTVVCMLKKRLENSSGNAKAKLSGMEEAMVKEKLQTLNESIKVIDSNSNVLTQADLENLISQYQNSLSEFDKKEADDQKTIVASSIKIADILRDAFNQ